MMLNSGYLTSTNTKNHITISTSAHTSAHSVELGAVIYNDLGVISPNWRKWHE